MSDRLYMQWWMILNQCLLGKNADLNTLDQHSRLRALHYFEKTSRYIILNLHLCSVNDLRLIAKYGYSETALKRSMSPDNLPINAATMGQDQYNLATHGFIQTACPFTGRNLKSNRSFFMGHLGFYRFVSQQVFYLICYFGARHSLYFPKNDLLLHLVHHSYDAITPKAINQFKACLVIHGCKVMAYLNNSNLPSRVAISYQTHPGHYLLNTLSGIQQLQDKHRLLDINKWFSIEPEYFGPLELLFPEIQHLDIEKIELSKSLDLFVRSLEKNFLLIWPNACLISNSLTKRLHNAAVHECRKTTQLFIKKVKYRHHPLLWIGFRFHNRIWISQVEGIANIINNLSQNFPRIGFVVDAFSLPPKYNGPVHLHGYPDSTAEDVIQTAKQIVQNIQTRLHKEVQLYDIVGCSMLESVLWAESVDLYIAPAGTTQHKVGWIGNKPGIVHSNSTLYQIPFSKRPGCWERENGIMPIYIPGKYVKDCLRDNQQIAGLQNYDFDWRIVADVARQVILATNMA